jgi:GNAT superfamily N-acetyltransferase
VLPFPLLPASPDFLLDRYQSSICGDSRLDRRWHGGYPGRWQLARVAIGGFHLPGWRKPEEHEVMTETLPLTRTTVGVRPYRPADHGACRLLWGELTSQHRKLYGDASMDGPDPGAGFEEYLTRLDLTGMWVADDRAEGVVGFAGLILDGRRGEIDPVVVAARRRGQGIGRSLLEFVAEQARLRGMRELSISPALRNIEAIHCLHAAGFDALTSVTLTVDLTGRRRSWNDGIGLHEKRFRY